MIGKKRYSGVVVKCNDKVLLCKRNNEGSLPGEWSVPGGKIEKNETPIDGAVREFHEETNLNVNSPLTLCGMIKRHNRDGSEVKGLMYTFLMEVNKEMMPDLKGAMDGSEHTECGYFGIDSFPTPIGDQLKTMLTNILKEKTAN